ncbi:hypothetical protein HPB48_011506 [Haemaphysalis longicornis]|uniref:G-protein coupled receptors family 1 profile domain-containing protein n=1 Tax=Haemaphysalis longicornis TaxID=44386 RepID=A0A9J6G4Z9_HAELO|nr:hypothetical protein HPB48_011506 [Haemaphysalis longicornis]
MHLRFSQVKTLKMTAVVFAAFLVTNVPYMVQEAILAFGNPDILNANVVALSGVISASNSAINPYIFLYFQKSRRRSSRGLLGTLLEKLPCYRRWVTRSDSGSQHRMATMTVTYSGRQSRTVTTVNFESGSERTSH